MPERRDLPAVLLDQWTDDTERLVGGGSSLFRQAATDLDVHWRLAAFDGAQPWMDPDRGRDLVDLAVIGAGLGVGLTARRMLTEGPFDLRPDEAMAERAVSALAEIDDPTRSAPAEARRRRRPRVQPGASMAFRTSVDPEYWEDRTLVDAAVVTTWVQARDVGLEKLRLQLTTSQPADEEPWEIAWVAVARQPLTPRMSVVAEVRGTAEAEAMRAGTPASLRSAVDLRVAPHQPIYLRAEASRRDRGEDEELERRVGVSIRANLAWRAPVRDAPWRLPGLGPGPIGAGEPTAAPDEAVADAEVRPDADPR